MYYVISDIHGCYEQFLKLLDKIHFSDKDILYVLGDSVDRGPEPIKLLTDLSMRANVYHILGNHEYMALTCLKKLMVEITEENCDTQLTKDDMTSYLHWMNDGGMTTIEQFRKLSPEEQEGLIEYMEEMPLYESVEVGEKCYLFVHAGISNFVKGKPMDAYTEADLLFERSDYQKKYFEHTILVTGHTPTITLSRKKNPEVLFFPATNQIAIDCGACYGGKLACLCLNTLKVFYE